MQTVRKQRAKTPVLAGLFLALGVVLPTLTGGMKEIGDSLLPMHLAVMLCGILCGGWYGLGTGLMMPFLRAAFFGMPPLYPNAVWMALELATYGLVIGLLYARGKAYRRGYLFFCLVSSMLLGRVVWGIAKAVLLGIGGKPFGWQAFFVGGFIDAVPGLLLQLVLIPLTVELLEKRKK